MHIDVLIVFVSSLFHAVLCEVLAVCKYYPLCVPPSFWTFSAGDFRREAGVFLERWVKGRGVPSITLGSVFQRKKGCTLEVAIRQVGSAAAKDAANAAELEAQREGIGTGVIKVSVREGSGATVDHPVHVGTAPLILARLGINPDVKKIHAKYVGYIRRDTSGSSFRCCFFALSLMSSVDFIHVGFVYVFLCRRGRKRKDEEDLIAEKQAELENGKEPALYWGTAEIVDRMRIYVYFNLMQPSTLFNL